MNSTNLINDLERTFHDWCRQGRPLYLSGMPFLYRGYNGLYKYNHTDSCYYRKEHEDYYGIPIKKTRLIYDEDNNRWILQQYNVLGYENTQFYQITACDLVHVNGRIVPFGDWTNGAMITQNQNWKTWMRSNTELSCICIMLICFLSLYFS